MVALILPYSAIYRHGVKHLTAVPAVFTDIRSALYYGCIYMGLQRHIPSIQVNHLLIAMHCVLGKTPSRQYQQCSMILAAPSIEVAFNILLCAIYRYPKEISGFFGSCIVQASPEIITFISRALHHSCIHIVTERHLPTSD